MSFLTSLAAMTVLDGMKIVASPIVPEGMAILMGTCPVCHGDDRYCTNCFGSGRTLVGIITDLEKGANR